jgi:arginyl-tRNA synthetase
MYSAGDVNKFSSIIPQQTIGAEPVAIKNEQIPHTFVPKPEETVKEENPFYTNYKNEKKKVFNIYDEMDENPQMREYLTEGYKHAQEEIDDEFTIDELNDEKMAAGGGIEDENIQNLRRKLNNKTVTELRELCKKYNIPNREQMYDPVTKTIKPKTHYILKPGLINNLINSGISFSL